MFSTKAIRQASASGEQEGKDMKVRASLGKKQSERRSSRKITFENLLSYVINSKDATFTAYSVEAMIEDIYTWSCLDGDTPIRLPSATDKPLNKMVPEGSIMDTRRSSKQPVGKESDKLDRNVEVDTASIVSSSNANEGTATRAITKGFVNFKVDPDMQHRYHTDTGSHGSQAFNYGPSSYHHQRNYSQTPRYPMQMDLRQADEEEEYQPPQRASVSRLHNSHAFAHVPDSPTVDPAVTGRRTRIIKVKKPMVNTAE